MAVCICWVWGQGGRKKISYFLPTENKNFFEEYSPWNVELDIKIETSKTNLRCNHDLPEGKHKSTSIVLRCDWPKNDPKIFQNFLIY